MSMLYCGFKRTRISRKTLSKFFFKLCEQKREDYEQGNTFRYQCYNINIVTTNKWVRTIHIHPKLEMALCEKANIKTSSTHKIDSVKKLKK